MSGIKLEVTANNSAPVLEDSFETLNENVGNIDYIVVDGTIATVFLKGPMQIPTRKVYIYGVPTYLRIYNSSTSKFENMENEGNLNSVDGANKMILLNLPVTNKSFSYYVGSSILSGIYRGGVVGYNVFGPLHARDKDMLCGDGSYSPCNEDCHSNSLPCIINPDFPAQKFSYKLLDVTPAWGKSYFTMIILNDHDYFVQTTHSINYEMIGETYNWDKKFILKVQVLDCATCDNPLTDIAKITVEINDTPEPPDAIDNLRTIRENTAS